LFSTIFLNVTFVHPRRATDDVIAAVAPHRVNVRRDRVEEDLQKELGVRGQYINKEQWGKTDTNASLPVQGAVWPAKVTRMKKGLNGFNE
jgi:hypothetical protein